MLSCIKRESYIPLGFICNKPIKCKGCKNDGKEPKPQPPKTLTPLTPEQAFNQKLLKEKDCGCGKSQEQKDEHFSEWQIKVEAEYNIKSQAEKLLFAERLTYCSQACGLLRDDSCPVCATLLKAGFTCPDKKWQGMTSLTTNLRLMMPTSSDLRF